MTNTGSPQVALRPTLQDQVRRYTNGLVLPIARAVGHWIDPNKLTVLSTLPFLIAGFLIYLGLFHWAGWAVLIGGVFDVLDGAVARATGKVTMFGGFLDSVMDRISDAVVFCALAAYFARTEPVLMGLAFTGLIAAMVTSYARARALEHNLTIKIGILDRLGRITIIVIGLLVSQPGLMTIILAILGTVTAWQRVRFAMDHLDQASTPS